MTSNPMNNKPSDSSSANNNHTSSMNEKSSNGDKKSSGILMSIFNSKKKSEDAEDVENGGAISMKPFSNMSKNPRDIAMEGYMVKASLSKSEVPKFGSVKMLWERRYFVLYNNGNLFYYKSRQKFRDEKNALKDRPLEVGNYYIAIFNSISTQNTDRDSHHSIQSIVSTNTVEGPIFPSDLVPKDDEEARRWQFRIDTEEELELWKDAFYEISPSSFK